MTGITGIGPSGAGGAITSTQGGSFGENPFLQLLVTQLSNQTPLEPVDNNSFMEQLATYNSMEEQKKLNTNMLDLLNFQGVLARLQSLSEGSAMLGKQVSFATPDGGEGKGVVTSVYVNQSGEVRLRMGEKEVGMNLVTGISEPPKAEPDPGKTNETQDPTT